LFFWRIQTDISKKEVVIIMASEEAIISKGTSDEFKFDKTIFCALANPLLFVACFVTLHLTEIFQIQGLSFILISSYILILYAIYKISKIKIIAQNRNLKKLKELINVDYNTCKFCGKQLSIKEFYNANKIADLQKISDIWNSNFYGLLCCKCFENTPSKFWMKFKSTKKLKNLIAPK